MDKKKLSSINIKSIKVNSSDFFDLPLHYKTQVLKWVNFGIEPTLGLIKYFK